MPTLLYTCVPTASDLWWVSNFYWTLNIYFDVQQLWHKVHWFWPLIPSFYNDKNPLITPEQHDLVVCWHMGTKSSTNWSIDDLSNQTLFHMSHKGTVEYHRIATSSMCSLGFPLSITVKGSWWRFFVMVTATVELF